MPTVTMPREIAMTIPREIADERTFTEAEHFAVLTAAVQRETADVTVERDQLRTQVEERQTALDVLTAERDTAAAERDAARTELAEYRAEVERAAEVAARTETRATAVREVTAHLPEYVTPERATRWAQMEQADFDALLADLKDAMPADDGRQSATTPPFRQTAAFGGGTTPTEKPGGSIKELLALRSAK